jgi:hypothetical protein
MNRQLVRPAILSCPHRFCLAQNRAAKSSPASRARKRFPSGLQPALSRVGRVSVSLANAQANGVSDAEAYQAPGGTFIGGALAVDLGDGDHRKLGRYEPEGGVTLRER